MGVNILLLGAFDMKNVTTDDERKALNSERREERGITSMSPMADMENKIDSGCHLQKNVIVKQYILDHAVRSPSFTFKTRMAFFFFFFAGSSVIVNC